MVQNQRKSVDELWNCFKSEISKIRNKLVLKQLSRIPSQKTKTFVMLYGTKVRQTGDGYHQK